MGCCTDQTCALLDMERPFFNGWIMWLMWHFGGDLIWQEHGRVNLQRARLMLVFLQQEIWSVGVLMIGIWQKLCLRCSLNAYCSVAFKEMPHFQSTCAFQLDFLIPATLYETINQSCLSMFAGWHLFILLLLFFCSMKRSACQISLYAQEEILLFAVPDLNFVMQKKIYYFDL